MNREDLLFSSSYNYDRPHSLYVQSSCLSDSTLIDQYNQSNGDSSFSRRSSIKDKVKLFFTHHKSRSHPSESLKSYETKINSNMENEVIKRSSKSSERKNVKRQSNNDDFKNKFYIGDIKIKGNYKPHQYICDMNYYFGNKSCSKINLFGKWRTMGLNNKILMPLLSIVPGLVGIENHGNTCFINVVVQCLAHIDNVAEFFSTKDYLKHLNYKNVSSGQSENSESRSLDVTIGFAYLLKSIWQNTYSSKISLKFCQLLGMCKPEYTLDSQQDADEFLLYMLNLLHESLLYKLPNNVVNSVNDASNTENSFVYDKFRLLMSNAVICSECKASRQSHEKMLSINLQISRKDRTADSDEIDQSYLFFILVINKKQNTEKHAIEVDSKMTVADLHECVSARLDCEMDDVLLVELTERGFGHIFYKMDLLLPICFGHKNSDYATFDRFGNGLYVVYIRSQIVDVDALTLSSIENKSQKNQTLTSHSSFIRLLIVHVERTKESNIDMNEDLRGYRRKSTNINRKQYYRFTKVLTVFASRKTTFSFLRYSLMDQMCKNLNISNVIKLIPPPQIVVERSYLLKDTDVFPLNNTTINKSLEENIKLYGEKSGFITLTVIWPSSTNHYLQKYRKNKVDGSEDSESRKLTDHKSVELLFPKYENQFVKSKTSSKENSVEESVSLSKCLDDFFKSHSLSEAENWFCPYCETDRPPLIQYKVQRAPKILIITFKRFQSSQDQITADTLDSQERNHINVSGGQGASNNAGKGLTSTVAATDRATSTGHDNEFVDFRQTSNLSTEENLGKLECLVDYPIKGLDFRSYMQAPDGNTDYIYDLIGVLNHRGTLTKGHYTSMCFHSILKKWFVFDDEKLKELTNPEQQVVNSDAYILFYQRRLLDENIMSESEDEEDIHWSYARLEFPNKYHRNHDAAFMSNKTNRMTCRTQQLPTTPSTFENLDKYDLVNNSQKDCKYTRNCGYDVQASNASNVTRQQQQQQQQQQENACYHNPVAPSSSNNTNITTPSSCRSSPFLSHQDSGAILSSDSLNRTDSNSQPGIDRQIVNNGNFEPDECYNSQSTSPTSLLCSAKTI